MPVLADFLHSWIMSFSHSPKTRKSQVDVVAWLSTTRWWSKWEVVKMATTCFSDIELFLVQNDDTGQTRRLKLLAFFSDWQKKQVLLQQEVATTVDWSEQL